jgi:hypothetical protein
VDTHPDSRGIRPGQVLTLTQPSRRRRSYELRRDGGQRIGWLHFSTGQRPVATAAGDEVGVLNLIASTRLVEVRGGQDAVAPIATIDRQPGGNAVIRCVQGRPLIWQRTGRRQWMIGTGDADLLQVTAAHGLVRASVRVTAQHDLPDQVAVLLGLIGGFLALRQLHAEIDASAAVAGIVSTTAG